MGRSKRVRGLSTIGCPQCGEIGGLKKIMFGMPDINFNHEKYISGGCVVSEVDPEIGCVKCGWEGMRRDCSRGLLD